MGCGGSKSSSGSKKSEENGAPKQPDAENVGGDTKEPKKADAKPAKGNKKKGKLLQVLVAGYAQSGKSTFFKQLQIIHLNGWSAEEKVRLMINLKSNIIQGMKELIEAAEDMEMDIPDDLIDAVKLFQEKNPFDDNAVDDSVVKQAKRLWPSDVFQKVWAKRDALSNLSVVNLDYFMQHIDRITAPGASPTDEDVLRTRSRTTGTVELGFCYENKQDFKFVDVGGQKSERRKWSQVIQNPDAVLYFTALPDFDVPIIVDSKKTKFDESLEIWEAVVNTPAFAATTIILFLNKVDLFAEKLKTVSMSSTFADYKGGSDQKAGAKYILSKFQAKVPQGPSQDTLQCHITCALDTEQIRTVFLAIRSSLTERALADIGF